MIRLPLYNGRVTPEQIVRIAVSVRKGDRESFGPIVEEYQGFVYNFALRLVGGDRERAYDLSSEVFLRVFANLSKYSPDYPFKSWLGRVTYTTGLNYLRKKKETVHIESLAEEVPFQVPDDSPNPEEIVVNAQIKEAIEKAIVQLKPDFRAIITLCDIQNVSYEDASKILGIPTGTVRSRLSRAREALKSKINGTI